MDEVRRLAAFVADTSFAQLPVGVVARAREVLRDTVGVIVAGMAEPEVAALADHALSREAPSPRAGGATLFGHGGCVRPDWAVLIHGTAGTALELDEGHAFARGHAAVHAAPVALALAEAAGASGGDALLLFVLGYEVAARVGVATRLRPAVHPFGTWGVLGAAAIAARSRGLDADATLGVLELAASYAVAPSFASALQGASVRNTYAGMVNRHGLLAAELYGLGFRGERGGVATTFGEILGASFAPEALGDGLGERYEISRGYFKPYSACRYTHGAITATLALRAEPDLAAGVERLVVETYDVAAGLREREPTTGLAGRFSLPYAVAACLVLGHADREAFTAEALADPRIRALARRVEVSEEPAFTAMTPERRPARVTLHLRDGRRLERTVYGSKGDPDQPMSADELEAKFLGLVAPTLGSARGRRLWDDLGRLDEVHDLSGLLALTRPDRARDEEVPMG